MPNLWTLNGLIYINTLIVISEGQIPHQEHQVDYREKYKALKKKLKFLVYVSLTFIAAL